MAAYNHPLKRYVSVCCSCNKSAAKSPALVAVFVPFAGERRDRFRPNARVPLFCLFYQWRSGIYNSRIENLQAAHSRPTSRHYNETVAIAGLLHRKVWIAGSVRSVNSGPATAGRNSIRFSALRLLTVAFDLHRPRASIHGNGG